MLFFTRCGIKPFLKFSEIQKRVRNHTLNVVSQILKEINIVCTPVFIFYYLFQPGNHIYKILILCLYFSFLCKLDVPIISTKQQAFSISPSVTHFSHSPGKEMLLYQNLRPSWMFVYDLNISDLNLR